MALLNSLLFHISVGLAQHLEGLWPSLLLFNTAEVLSVDEYTQSPCALEFANLD